MIKSVMVVLRERKLISMNCSLKAVVSSEIIVGERKRKN
jgi:hypothetical protein